MKYAGWIVHNTRSILWNTIVRVVSGTAQVALGLFMVWLSRRFIDETIRTGSPREIRLMILWLVLTVLGGVLLRQYRGEYMSQYSWSEMTHAMLESRVER